MLVVHSICYCKNKLPSQNTEGSNNAGSQKQILFALNWPRVLSADWSRQNPLGLSSPTVWGCFTSVTFSSSTKLFFCYHLTLQTLLQNT